MRVQVPDQATHELRKASKAYAGYDLGQDAAAVVLQNVHIESRLAPAREYDETKNLRNIVANDHEMQVRFGLSPGSRHADHASVVHALRGLDPLHNAAMPVVRISTETVSYTHLTLPTTPYV